MTKASRLGGWFVAKVLVIDDDLAYREYLERVLTHAGHVVETEANGARILRIVAAERFDAIITDLYMPECDGIETIGRLRSVLPNIPIIGMTGSTGAEDDPCSRAMRMFGAVAVLEKPLDRERLLAVLDKAIAEASDAREKRPVRRKSKPPIRAA
jgi:DNA-binding NtrC family response regulator